MSGQPSSVTTPSRPTPGSAQDFFSQLMEADPAIEAAALKDLLLPAAEQCLDQGSLHAATALRWLSGTAGPPTGPSPAGSTEIGHWPTIFRDGWCRSTASISIPAAQIGAGIFIDHAVGIVIGETAVVEDEVTIFQSVTLGGTGKGRRRSASENSQAAPLSVPAHVVLGQYRDRRTRPRLPPVPWWSNP